MSNPRAKKKNVKLKTGNNEVTGSIRDNQDSYLLELARPIFDKVSLESEEQCTKAFLALKVYKFRDVLKVSSYILEVAVEKNENFELYARMCYAQCKDELADKGDINKNDFCKSLNWVALHTLEKWKEEYRREVRERLVHEKSRMKKKNGKRIERPVAKVWQKKTFSVIIFIWQLIIEGVLTEQFIKVSVDYLLDWVKVAAICREDSEPSQLGGCNDETDEESVKFVLQLLETYGKRVQAILVRTKKEGAMSDVFGLLNQALPLVGDDCRLMITRAQTLRRNGWRENANGGNIKTLNILNIIKMNSLKAKEAEKQQKNERSMKDLEHTELTSSIRPSDSLSGNAEHSSALYPQVEPIEPVIAPPEATTDDAKYWKDRFEKVASEKEETERKYRRLLLMVGRGKLTGT